MHRSELKRESSHWSVNHRIYAKSLRRSGAAIEALIQIEHSIAKEQFGTADPVRRNPGGKVPGMIRGGANSKSAHIAPDKDIGIRRDFCSCLATDKQIDPIRAFVDTHHRTDVWQGQDCLSVEPAVSLTGCYYCY